MILKKVGSVYSPYDACLVTRIRLCSLQDLDQTLMDFYLLYNHKVDSPYSIQEQEVLVRIIKSITAQLQKKGKPGQPLRKITFLSLTGIDLSEIQKMKYVCFRFELPANQPFSCYSRLSCLHQLNDYFVRFFMSLGSEVIDVPYSFQEQKTLKRIKKLLIHQLRGTDKYRMFKKKCPPRNERMAPEEKQELENQRKDEILLRAVNGKITRYNPRSKKYKALKEDTIRKITEME